MADKVNRLNLVSIINKVRPAVSAQDFIPVMACVCFTEGEIYAYNDMMAISFPNAVDFPFEGAIPGDQLVKVLNSFKTENISCSVAENDVTILSGKSRVKLPFFKEEDLVWEGLPSKNHTELELDAEFIEGLKLCLISIGQDAMHSEHMGIQVMCEDGETFFYSTDNATVSQYEYSAEADADDFGPVVFPELFCRQIIALFPEMEDPILYINDASAWVMDESSEIKIFCKFIHTGDGTNFAEIMRKYAPDIKGKFHSISDTGIIEALERAAIINGDISGETIAIAKKGILKLETKTSGGQSSDEIKLDKDKSIVEVGFSTSLVLRACKTLDKFAFRKGIILFKSGKKFVHIIAPRG